MWAVERIGGYIPHSAALTTVRRLNSQFDASLPKSSFNAQKFLFFYAFFIFFTTSFAVLTAESSYFSPPYEILGNVKPSSSQLSPTTSYPPSPSTSPQHSPVPTASACAHTSSCSLQYAKHLYSSLLHHHPLSCFFRRIFPTHHVCFLSSEFFHLKRYNSCDFFCGKEAIEDKLNLVFSTPPGKKAVSLLSFSSSLPSRNTLLEAWICDYSRYLGLEKLEKFESKTRLSSISQATLGEQPNQSAISKEVEFFCMLPPVAVRLAIPKKRQIYPRRRGRNDEAKDLPADSVDSFSQFSTQEVSKAQSLDLNANSSLKASNFARPSTHSRLEEPLETYLNRYLSTITWKKKRQSASRTLKSAADGSGTSKHPTQHEQHHITHTHHEEEKLGLSAGGFDEHHSSPPADNANASDTTSIKKASTSAADAELSHEEFLKRKLAASQQWEAMFLSKLKQQKQDSKKGAAKAMKELNMGNKSQSAQNKDSSVAAEFYSKKVSKTDPKEGVAARRKRGEGADSDGAKRGKLSSSPNKKQTVEASSNLAASKLPYFPVPLLQYPKMGSLTSKSVLEALNFRKCLPSLAGETLCGKEELRNTSRVGVHHLAVVLYYTKWSKDCKLLRHVIHDAWKRLRGKNLSCLHDEMIDLVKKKDGEDAFKRRDYLRELLPDWWPSVDTGMLVDVDKDCGVNHRSSEYAKSHDISRSNSLSGSEDSFFLVEDNRMKEHESSQEIHTHFEKIRKIPPAVQGISLSPRDSNSESTVSEAAGDASSSLFGSGQARVHEGGDRLSKKNRTLKALVSFFLVPLDNSLVIANKAHSRKRLSYRMNSNWKILHHHELSLKLMLDEGFYYGRGDLPGLKIFLEEEHSGFHEVLSRKGLKEALECIETSYFDSNAKILTEGNGFYGAKLGELAADQTLQGVREDLRKQDTLLLLKEFAKHYNEAVRMVKKES